ncbi:hypothetical protein D3C87_278710 [compost metagenome]
MYVPKHIQDLFKVEFAPITVEDIPQGCNKKRSKVVLDNLQGKPVKVHYKQYRNVLSQGSV